LYYYYQAQFNVCLDSTQYTLTQSLGSVLMSKTDSHVFCQSWKKQQKVLCCISRCRKTVPCCESRYSKTEGGRWIAVCVAGPARFPHTHIVMFILQSREHTVACQSAGVRPIDHRASVTCQRPNIFLT